MAMPPYAPPPPWAPPPAPVAAARSTTAQTLGVLSITFGALAIASELFDLIFVALLAYNPLKRASLSSPAIDDAMRALALYTAARVGAMLLLSTALVVVGVALWRHAAWSRVAGIAWSIVALASLVVRGVVYAIAVAPRIAAAAYEVIGAWIPLPPGARPGTSFTSEYTGMILLAAYPIVLLVLLNGREIRAYVTR